LKNQKRRRSWYSLLKRKLKLSYVLNAVLIIAAVVLAYREIFRSGTLEKLRFRAELISVAVIPFLNMTNDSTWDIWQNGFQDNLVASLSNYPDELQVRQVQLESQPGCIIR
jgi:hypothetical protein